VIHIKAIVGDKLVGGVSYQLDLKIEKIELESEVPNTKDTKDTISVNKKL
jgi:hypothetical protein